jgi:chromosome segregation ATPase
MKMFVYLAVAVGTGFGAGWLTRNLDAKNKEEELQRTLTETKARLPQFESLMRSRDEQLKSLGAEVKDKDARIGELHGQVDNQAKLFTQTKQQLKNAQHQLAATDGHAGAPESASTASDLDTELSEVDASVNADGGGDVAGSSSAMEEVLRSEVHELESRLRQTSADQDRLSKALEQEKRAVAELRGERELQNRSLQVLHQQLELAGENAKQAASG